MLVMIFNYRTRTVELPRVLPSKFDVFNGSDKLARGMGEMLRMPTPPPVRTDVEMGSKLAFAKELPRKKRVLLKEQP